MRITIQTHKKNEVIDITDIVQEELENSKSDNGVCTVFALHTTCSLTTADFDPGTDEDLLNFLQRIIPEMSFNHPHNPEHAPDHIISSIIGSSVSIPYENKNLQLGTWQRIVLVELDGPRERTLTLSVY